VSIEGWALVDKHDRTQILSGSIPPTSSLSIDLKTNKIILANSGGTIILKDVAGNQVHRVAYTGSQVKTSMEVVF
jgi:hypothetical protein